MLWVLPAGAGAGGLAPELPFLPVLTKNRDGKDAASSVRQCWGGGDAYADTAPHFLAREAQPPIFPMNTPCLPQSSFAAAATGPGSRVCWGDLVLSPKGSVNILIGL